MARVITRNTTATRRQAADFFNKTKTSAAAAADVAAFLAANRGEVEALAAKLDPQRSGSVTASARNARAVAPLTSLASTARALESAREATKRRKLTRFERGDVVGREWPTHSSQRYVNRDEERPWMRWGWVTDKSFVKAKFVRGVDLMVGSDGLFSSLETELTRKDREWVFTIPQRACSIIQLLTGVDFSGTKIYGTAEDLLSWMNSLLADYDAARPRGVNTPPTFMEAFMAMKEWHSDVTHYYVVDVGGVLSPITNNHRPIQWWCVEFKEVKGKWGDSLGFNIHSPGKTRKGLVGPREVLVEYLRNTLQF